MLLTVLRFNFASPQGEPRTQGKLISAALELAQWGESRGITMVSVDEHHATGHGWSCNPIMAAAMFLARTERLIASVDCALGPLWNPVRLAEDIALVDNMSRAGCTPRWVLATAPSNTKRSEWISASAAS